jgi:UDP-2,3-diacylglucosamine pyrophosphatase LpxH
MRHTVVLSDIHLAEAEPGTGLWMRYRQKEVSPDREIAAMLGELRERVEGHDLTVVLNGDIFDFDAPRVINGESVFHDLPRDAEHTLPAARRILDDHEELVDALGRVLDDGHTVVLISGNHDVQLTLPEVRRVIAERLIDAALRVREAESAGGAPDQATRRASLERRILFRAWFHKTEDGIVIEHGNQYDPYCCYRYPMEPFGRDPGTIQPTLGSLAARLLAARMGYFNPHVDTSCMLSAWGYIAHWFRFYMFSQRSLAIAWMSGAVRSVIELARRRDPERRERRRANIAACARETGVPLKMAARHARLFAPPVEDRLVIAMRELWLDRVAIGAFCALLAAIWLIWAPGGLGACAALAPSILVAYELINPKKPIGDVWSRVDRAARCVAKVHRASAVVFGHTHHPQGAWESGVFFGNTGSWSAAFRDLECTQPLFDERPLVWLTSGFEDGELRGGLVTWKAEGFTFDPTAGRSPAFDGRAFEERAAVARALPAPSAGAYKKYDPSRPCASQVRPC